jgi:hypothetical protein
MMTAWHRHRIYLIQEFLPMFISYFRFCFGRSHRIELSNRLLYGFMLKQEAPFQRTQDASNIFLWQYCLQAYLCFSIPKPRLSWFIFLRHFSQSFKSKDCKTKELYIKDSWRSLYESIYSAIDGDQDLLGLLLFHSKDLYEAALKTASKPSTSLLSRKGLKNIITGSCFHWKSNILSCIEQSPKTCKQGIMAS